MEKRLSIALLALMLLASTQMLFAQGTQINSGWGENVEARVLDAYDRPIQGASVNVTWPLTGVKWATTPNKLTDARGRAYFSIDTYEFIREKVIYDFYVSARYNGVNATVKYDHNISAGSPRTVWLPVYRVTFKASDHGGKPMKIDVVIDDTIRVSTDEKGWAKLPLAAGTHNVSMWYGRNEQKTTLFVKDDMLAAHPCMSAFVESLGDRESFALAEAIQEVPCSSDDLQAMLSCLVEHHVLVACADERYAWALDPSQPIRKVSKIEIEDDFT